MDKFQFRDLEIVGSELFISRDLRHICSFIYLANLPRTNHKLINRVDSAIPGRGESGVDSR